MSTSPPPARSAEWRARRLAVTKRQATMLLAGVAVVWLGVSLLGSGATWARYVQATAEASMVGGLADWFAVTALFRRPLGLPIPHTAIITERKDQFGETLGEFVRESFLTPAAVLERLRATHAVDRASQWLAQPENAARVASHVADAVVSVVDFQTDGEVRSAIEGLLRDRIDAVEVAPLAGRALQWLAAEDRDADLVDALLRAVDKYLGVHGSELRARLGERPWWLPAAVEDRLVERFIDGAHTMLGDMVGRPTHPLRRDLQTALAKLGTDLTTSPDLIQRGERLKRDFLSRSTVSEWAESAWEQAKAQLRSQAADPESQLRSRLAASISSSASRLSTDEALRASAEEAIETAVVFALEHFDSEISGVVSSTIARWDAAETSQRLELLLGPDLQYIRINGTVVGALAGLVLYAVAQAVR